MRKKWIDSAKGIAILLVIIGHTSNNLKGFWNFKFVYGIHLVMFFLLSGYTLKKKTVTREFINQKFRRLMLPYFYTCIAIIITDIFNSWYLNHDASINTVTRILAVDLLRSFFASGSYKKFGAIDLGARIGAIWFLPALFFAVIMFQLLLKYRTDDRFPGIASGVIAFTGYLSAKFIWLPFSLQSGMMACFFLWIGYEINKHKLLDHLKWYHYITAQFLLLFGIFNNYCNISFVKADISDLFISIPVGLSGCLLIYLFAKIDRGGVFEYIGKISLTVLCTHLYALETLGRYLNKILDKIHLNGNSRVWTFILLEIIFAVFAASVIEKINKLIMPAHEKLKKRFSKRSLEERDAAIDIAKGIFVISMLIGHFKINSMLRSIIYSCHMVAFIFFSGYFYKSRRGIWDTVRHLIHTFLVPYMVFLAGVILINYQNMDAAYMKETIIRYLFGISFTRKLFSEIPSVGPVYFILMLFIVRIMYTFIDHYIKNEKYKLLIIVCVSVFGMLLGNEEYWLPWSIDVACYVLIYYQIGIYCMKYDVLSKIKNNHIVYFVLTPVWVYMIYTGGMEIAVRDYTPYGLVILGSVAGVLSIYKLSAYISNFLPVIREILRLTGESSIIIIIFHTLLNRKICHLLSYRFDRRCIPYMVSAILLQILLSWLIRKILKFNKLLSIRIPWRQTD